MKIENCHHKIEDRIDLRPCPLLAVHSESGLDWRGTCPAVVDTKLFVIRIVDDDVRRTVLLSLDAKADIFGWVGFPDE